MDKIKITHPVTVYSTDTRPNSLSTSLNAERYKRLATNLPIFYSYVRNITTRPQERFSEIQKKEMLRIKQNKIILNQIS